MLVEINGVQVETTAQGGLVYMNNRSGENRFIYNPRTKRSVRLGADSCVHYAVNPSVGFRIMLPSEITETKGNLPGYAWKDALKRLWPW